MCNYAIIGECATDILTLVLSISLMGLVIIIVIIVYTIAVVMLVKAKAKIQRNIEDNTLDAIYEDISLSQDQSTPADTVTRNVA